MPLTQIKPTFTTGELSPSLFGRVDFKGYQQGASVFRNLFVSFKGPASSRAGLAYVAKSLTPASVSSLPPRIIRFQFNIYQSYLLEFGANSNGTSYMRVYANGAPVTEAPINITNVSLANPCQITAPSSNFSNGDWVYLSGIGGTTQLNGRTCVVHNATANTLGLFDLFGNPINAVAFSAYTGGGLVSRIYTSFASPYALADLPYLKVVQSADVMSLCCVNQQTGTEYPPYDLTRLAANNWLFAQTTFASVAVAPTGCAAVANVTTMTTPTQYAYCVTSIDDATGQESIASNVAYITNSVDIAITAGSHTITWNTVAGASNYNIYQAPPAYDTPVPTGSVFGYLGTAVGNQFVNSNIQADLTKTPPLHNNPFARGQVLAVGTIPVTGTFAQATTSAVINTATGSNAVIIPVVVSGNVVNGIVQNAGGGYASVDTVTFTDSGSSATTTAPLIIGPQTGTYPAVVNYFQQRRVYANTLNNPDTEFFSQTGAYTNMDSSTPPIDSDAIITTPWGQQVNGVQWLQPMPGGLITATGLDCWQVTGASGAGTAVTPASQQAVPQESNGFSTLVKPIRVNNDILYLQQLGTVVRDIQYNFFTNMYAGGDVSLLSSHLFDGYQLTAWAWAKIPWKVVWASRSDGKFLSFTYDKQEQLQGWARHDTNGLVVGNEVVTENPVDAPYFVVKRYIIGQQQWAYYIERMDNRLWNGPEDPWCIDAGLALTQPAPNATLSASSAAGAGNISGGYIAAGGQGYTAPGFKVYDPSGLGSGFVISFTVTGGAITGFSISASGQNYSPATQVFITDPTGAGATFLPFVSQNVTFNASAAVFANNSAGDVIRVGGGQAVVQSINSPIQVVASITVPITATIPNDPNNIPAPAAPGTWSITTPVSTVTGLYHLEGLQVTGLADGAVIPLTTVVNGSLTLPQPASSIKVGLPFIAQLQSMPLEVEQMGSIRGNRKRITGCSVVFEKTRGAQMGANQPVASLLDYQQEIPWTNMVDLPEYPNANIPSAAVPLFSGTKFQPMNDDYQNWDGFQASPGMAAVQQTLPLPLNILAFIPTFVVGDTKPGLD